MDIRTVSGPVSNLRIGNASMVFNATISSNSCWIQRTDPNAELIDLTKQRQTVTFTLPSGEAVTGSTARIYPMANFLVIELNQDYRIAGISNPVFGELRYDYADDVPWQMFQSPPGATGVKVTVVGGTGGRGPDSKSIAGIVSLVKGVDKLKGTLHDAESQLSQVQGQIPALDGALGYLKSVQGAVAQVLSAVQNLANATSMIGAEVSDKIGKANMAKDAATVSLARGTLSEGFTQLRDDLTTYTSAVSSASKSIDSLNPGTGLPGAAAKTAADISKRVHDVTSRASSASTGLLEFTVQQNHLLSTISTNGGDVTQALATLQEISSDVSSQCAEVQELAQQVSSLKSDVEKGVSAVNSQLSSLNKQRTDLQSQVEALRSEKEDLLKRIEHNPTSGGIPGPAWKISGVISVPPNGIKLRMKVGGSGDHRGHGWSNGGSGGGGSEQGRTGGNGGGSSAVCLMDDEFPIMLAGGGGGGGGAGAFGHGGAGGIPNSDQGNGSGGGESGGGNGGRPGGRGPHFHSAGQSDGGDATDADSATDAGGGGGGGAGLRNVGYGEGGHGGVVGGGGGGGGGCSVFSFASDKIAISDQTSEVSYDDIPDGHGVIIFEPFAS